MKAVLGMTFVMLVALVLRSELHRHDLPSLAHPLSDTFTQGERPTLAEVTAPRTTPRDWLTVRTYKDDPATYGLIRFTPRQPAKMCVDYGEAQRCVELSRVLTLIRKEGAVR